ncbi:MAG: hypothetical protein ACHQC8_07295 [Solirubrobacterales bacterium]
MRRAFEELMEDQQADFAVIEETLANGEEAAVTERKALYLLADHPDQGLTSTALATRYVCLSAGDAGLPRSLP